MRRSATKRALAAVVLIAIVVLGAAALRLRPAFLFPEPPRPNIVVLMVDTLRPDHLGAYGYGRDTSPAIDALAQRGTVFTSAYSVSNWTNPAIKSMLTGRSPQAVMEEARHRDAVAIPLPPSVTTFAELLTTRGYRTAALIDHPGIKPWGNFDQGFEDYVMLYEEGAESGEGWSKSGVDYVARLFAEQLDDYGDDPFLLYLHVIYPHRPYEPPSPYRGAFGPDSYDDYDPSIRAAIINAYDAEVLRTDDLVARLERALRARGRLEDTWILLVSDHGEGFWEHGFAEHGHVFFDEVIKIPMILVPPVGQQEGAERVDAPVSNLDVFATVLDIAGVAIPAGTEGFSLAPGGRGRGRSSRILFSESAHSYDIHARTIIRDGYKYMNYPGRPERQRNFLFDLGRDPRELDNLFGTRSDLEADLEGLLEDHRARSAAQRSELEQTTVQPDEETLERLRALGYIR